MSIKALEIETSIAFNLAFPSNNVLSCFFLLFLIIDFFLLFLIIDLCFLIPAVITQIFSPTAEFTKPTGMQTNVASAEIETQPVIVEAKINA